MTNREFWKTMKAFLASKGCLDNIDIMLGGDNKMIDVDDKRLGKLFNEQHCRTVQWLETRKNTLTQ